MTHPKVTVILPTHSRAPLLQQAIDSIRQQTLTDWELIIIDDASGDTTPEMVRAWTQKDPRIRYYRHDTNRGAAAARNTGLEHARGTYVAFQDDDDVSHPERLHRQADYLDKHPHVALLYTHLVNFSGDKAPPVSFYAKAHRPQTNYATLMGPRAIYQNVLFRPFFFAAEDLDFTKRVIDDCRDKLKRTDVNALLQHPLYAWRAHNHDVSLGTHHHHAIYCILCGLSAAHRQHGFKDPVDNARSVDDVLYNIDPRFPPHLHQHNLMEETDMMLMRWLLPDDHSERAPLQMLISNFILRYVTPPAAIEPKQQQNAAWAQQLAARFAHHLSHKPRRHRAIIKSCLHETIRHNQFEDYQNILQAILSHYPVSSLLLLAPKILFACLKRGRVRFIVAYLRALMKKTP